MKDERDRFRKKLGKYKTWLNRVQSYIAPLNFVMILYLYIVQQPLDMPWYLWVVVLVFFLSALLIFDVLFVFPSESQYIWRVNPDWRELRQDIKEIKESLGCDVDVGSGVER